MNIGILASHNGSNLQAIIDATVANDLSSKVVVVISNNSNSGAISKAKNANIPFKHLSGVTHGNPDQLDDAILYELKTNNCDIIFLAGYMKKLGPKTLTYYQGKIYNTHPALLPKFGGKGMYGKNVHNAVILANEKITGITIHLVDKNYDTGKIVAQTSVTVLPNDTPNSLCNRVMDKERKLVVETIKKLETLINE